MKRLFKPLLQRISDHLHERQISALYREYHHFLRTGKHVVATAVMRDIKDAIANRSLQQWSRIRRKQYARLDPHAQAVLRQESRA